MANSQTSSFGRSLNGNTPPAGSRHPDLALADVVAVRYGGLLPTAALRDVGVTPHRLRRLCTTGVLHGIRRGVYVAGERWRAADADERYRLLVRATVLAAGHPPVLSHQSAAVLHGLPTIGAWPDTVHALTPDASGGSNAAHVTGHRGPPPDAGHEIEGCQVTPLARTLVDVAVASSFLVAVTMLDHALRVEHERQTRPGALRPGEEPDRPALTKGDLYRELAAVNPRTGRRRAEHAITFADPLSANPGETLSRVRIFQLGFEVPELQVCFPDIEGRNAYVDFWWRRVRKIGEFDGFLKYGAGSVVGDRDPGVVVWAEKKREDALRARAASFDRWGWDLALSPARFHAFLTERRVPRA
jgi:predicted transcriptional regulator of viral defense system